MLKLFVGLSTSKGVCVIGITKSGRVYHVEQDMTGFVTSATQSSLTSQSSTKRMKATLVSISKVSEQLANVQAKLKSQQAMLVQLAVAGLLATHYNVADTYKKTAMFHKGAPPSSHEPPVVVSTKLLNHNLGSHLEFTLVVWVSNKCPVELNNRWSFLVAISGCASEDVREVGVSSPAPKCWHIIKTIRLTTFEVDGFQEVHVDLPPAAVCCLPLVVKPSLILTRTDTQQTLYKDQEEISSSTNLPIPLPVLTIDILHILVPLQSATPSVHMSSRGSLVDKNILSLAQQRPASNFVTMPNSEETAATGPYTCTVHVRPSRIKSIIRSNTGKDGSIVKIGMYTVSKVSHRIGIIKLILVLHQNDR